MVGFHFKICISYCYCSSFPRVLDALVSSGRQTVRQAGWLVGRQDGWLAGWLAGRLSGWLAGCLVGRLVGWKVLKLQQAK